VIVRKLGAEDALVWRAIRLEGLKTFPDAYLTTYDDVVGLPEEALAEQVMRNPTFVAFDGDEPVGSMVYIPETRISTRHRATIVAVYVRKVLQGQGVAEALLEALIEGLPPHILQLHLEVAAPNARARAFYERHGFKVTGTIPRAVLRDGIGVDDLTMVRMLDRKPVPGASGGSA
jgi:ribosomal protein S18 acetylase RimI-like enzyme